VAEQGCVHLGGLLKVTAEYNAKGKRHLSIKKHLIIELLRFSGFPIYFREAQRKLKGTSDDTGSL
jgi:hypothetical protein